MILLPYDGSIDAQAAVHHAARLMPGAHATVITIWEPYLETLAYGGDGMGLISGGEDYGRIDDVTEAAAMRTATEGAQRATAAGLAAQSRAVTSRGDVSDAILSAAAEIHADLVVMGTRGRSGVASLVLGSVSHSVVQRADRAVTVVPAAATIERRAEHLRHLVSA